MSDSHDDDVNEFRSSVQESLPSSAPVVEERQDTNESDQSRRVPVGTQKCSNVGVGNHLQPSVHGEIFGPATKAPIHEDLELEGQGARDQNDFLAPCPLGPIQSSDIPVVPTVDNVDEVNSKAQYPLFVAPPLSKQLEKPQDQSLVVPKPIVVTPDFQQNKGSVCTRLVNWLMLCLHVFSNTNINMTLQSNYWPLDYEKIECAYLSHIQFITN